MKSLEELRIWQGARAFVNQIQRAAVSVMNNIAEGFDYGSDPMFIKFLDIAKASCGEVKSMLYLAEDRNYCSNEKASELREKSKSISSGIHALIKYLKNRNNE